MMAVEWASLLLIGVELLAESDAQLLAETFQALEVLLVLFGGLDLGFDTCYLVVNR